MAADLPSHEPSPSDLKVLWTRGALFFAVVGVLGSLHLSLSMELKACPLCFYQRAFMMATAGVLAFGMFLPGMPSAAQAVLALVPALAGAGIALWHTYLDWAGVLECPKGITGVLVAPQESLIIFALVTLCLLGDLILQGKYVLQGIGAILLGIVFCTTSIRATPAKMTEPAPAPLDGCRKVMQTKT